MYFCILLALIKIIPLVILFNFDLLIFHQIRALPAILTIADDISTYRRAAPTLCREHP